VKFAARTSTNTAVVDYCKQPSREKDLGQDTRGVVSGNVSVEMAHVVEAIIEEHLGPQQLTRTCSMVK
jgi:hypothetical protein